MQLKCRIFIDKTCRVDWKKSIQNHLDNWIYYSHVDIITIVCNWADKNFFSFKYKEVISFELKTKTSSEKPKYKIKTEVVKHIRHHRNY